MVPAGLARNSDPQVALRPSRCQARHSARQNHVVQCLVEVMPAWQVPESARQNRVIQTQAVVRKSECQVLEFVR